AFARAHGSHVRPRAEISHGSVSVGKPRCAEMPVVIATTTVRMGIHTAARMPHMGNDLLALLQRDHQDLERGLTELVEAGASARQIRDTLDGIRLGLTAHAEAEDIVLHAVVPMCSRIPELTALVSEVRAAHLAQEAALAALVCAPPGSITWCDRAQR